MEENKDNREDELREAYEADKERRSVREDELQAAQDYLGVLLKEIEEKNKELEQKQAEADKLADALKKSEDEKQEEQDAAKQAVEYGRYKSIWIGIAIIEFLAIIAVVVSLFIVYNELKKDYEIQLEEARGENSNGSENITDIVTPIPSTMKIHEDLQSVVSAVSKKLNDGFTCKIDKIDELEYLVFEKDNFRVCYKNEYSTSDRSFRNAVIVEKGEKRIYEKIDYSFDKDPEKLCPRICKIGGIELVLVSDYSGFGNLPETFRLYDINTLAEYYGDDIREKLSSLMNLSFPENPSGLSEAPILMELATSRATYRYGLNDAGFNEIGYSSDEESGEIQKDIADISSNFMLTFEEDGISWKTVVKLGRRYYLGELRGNLALGAGSVVVTNASFGAYVAPNVENEEFGGIILPAESIPERYVTLGGYNSERYYVPVNENVSENKYNRENLNIEDPNNWVYNDENGNPISIKGIDVSKYQGAIDWKQVASSGVEFAIIRMGYRGMKEGTLEFDPYFETNMKGAAEAGIKTGVYFFSQAISEAEAEEEANFVIGALSRYDVSYPVVFDTERITTSDARANSLSYEERTAICIAFCEKILKAGYTPVIYANTKFMVMGIDLEKLEKYDKWFACYDADKAMDYPYDYKILQYSDTGSIPGIKGDVDLDIAFKDYSVKDDSVG